MLIHPPKEGNGMPIGEKYSFGGPGWGCEEDQGCSSALTLSPHLKGQMKPTGRASWGSVPEDGTWPTEIET